MVRPDASGEWQVASGERGVPNLYLLKSSDPEDPHSGEERGCWITGKFLSSLWFGDMMDARPIRRGARDAYDY
ncbi:MAG: hypothetical protein O2901_06500 [Verrucomicrobia bacterium]|nr:hypothetical protein [Verrucomicrobiota bacterium]